jgi:hypothetical protein
MQEYSGRPESAAAEGRFAKERIQNWSFERTVDGFLSAFRAGAASGAVSPRASLAFAGGRHA